MRDYAPGHTKGITINVCAFYDKQTAKATYHPNFRHSIKEKRPLSFESGRFTMLFLHRIIPS